VREGDEQRPGGNEARRLRQTEAAALVDVVCCEDVRRSDVRPP
jgi:hypothetical protein